MIHYHNFFTFNLQSGLFNNYAILTSKLSLIFNLNRLTLISEAIRKENPESSKTLEALQNRIAELEEEKGHFQLETVEHDEIKGKFSKYKNNLIDIILY